MGLLGSTSFVFRLVFLVLVLVVGVVFLVCGGLASFGL